VFVERVFGVPLLAIATPHLASKVELTAILLVLLQAMLLQAGLRKFARRVVRIGMRKDSTNDSVQWRVTQAVVHVIKL
jgi:hypothetical protein